jgi:DNA-binding PadR family transcriptional regulator
VAALDYGDVPVAGELVNLPGAGSIFLSVSLGEGSASRESALAVGAGWREPLDGRRRASRSRFDSGKLSSYSLGVRRKADTLLPLEALILTAGLERGEFHGYSLARGLQEREAARRLTAHGTLYKALGRMETAGLLASRWERAESAAADGRPRRRLYEVTGLGARALATWQVDTAAATPRGGRGLALGGAA